MLKRKVLSLAISVAVSVSCLFSISSIASAAAPIKVACIGDSITHGDGSTDWTKYSYPAQLQNLLGGGYVVNNYGLSGTTMLTNGDNPYENYSYYTTDSVNWQPNIVIIQLGTNDSKPQNWTTANKTKFVTDYVNFINHYKNLASHPTVYAALCPTVAGTGNYGITNPVVTNEVVPAIRQAATQAGISIIDNNSVTQNMPQNFPDNVHPNNDGVYVIASNVYKSLGASSSNLALGKTSTANQSLVNESPCRTLDGTSAYNSKWCSNAVGDKWLRVDLGQSATISRWVVKHAGEGGEAIGYNTKNFKLQKSTDGTTWVDVDTVTNNTANITNRTVTAFSARYVRLYITTPTQTTDTAARIYEFEVYNTPGATTVFSSGFEPAQTQPTWSDTVEAKANVTGYQSGVNPECSIRNNELAHNGLCSLMFSGTDNSTSQSYCYYKVFDVNIPIAATTKLSYWFYPQQENGRHVAVDFICTDGTTLRDSGTVDQNGINIHPATGRGMINFWNYVECNLGTKLAGKTIDRINIGYDYPAATGQYRGYIDDLTIQ